MREQTPRSSRRSSRPSPCRRHGKVQGGFTLIELLIVVAIIGVLAAMLIPNLMDALQKAKQKRTMADMRFAGTAMMAWLTDQVAAGAAGASSAVALADYPAIGLEDLETHLVDQYIQEVPIRDGWKNPLEYRFDANAQDSSVFAIRSNGRGGVADADSYTTSAFHPTDYEQDIVWADGFFVRWPEGQGN